MAPATTVFTPPAYDAARTYLAEFTAIRSEITTFLTMQGQFLSISVALIAAFVTLAGSGLRTDLIPLASLGAIPFLVMGLLYADLGARIIRAARYINTVLRPKLPELQWESYLRDPHPGDTLMTVLDFLRWSLFVLPPGVFTYIGFENGIG